MNHQDRERRMTLNKQKIRRRSLTPDEQDDELAREAKKTVSLGDDFMPKYDLALESGEIERRIDDGVIGAIKHQDAKRK